MSTRKILIILCGLILLAGPALTAASPAAYAQGCPANRCR
jgi:hypothetical protein